MADINNEYLTKKLSDLHRFLKLNATVSAEVELETLIAIVKKNEFNNI